MFRLKSSDANKFFPERADEMWFTEQGLFSITPTDQSKVIASLITNCKFILDANACIGGNTWAFAKRATVIATEIDETNFKALKHNMEIMNIDVTLEQDSFLKYILPNESNPFCMLDHTAIFLDPEWGGVDYTTKQYKLEYSTVGYENSFSGDKISLDTVINKAEKIFDQCLIKVPNSYKKPATSYKYSTVYELKDTRGKPIYKLILFSKKPIETSPVIPTFNRVGYKQMKLIKVDE